MDDVENGFIVCDGGAGAQVKEVFGELGKLFLYLLQLSIFLGKHQLQKVLLVLLHHYYV